MFLSSLDTFHLPLFHSYQHYPSAPIRCSLSEIQEDEYFIFHPLHSALQHYWGGGGGSIDSLVVSWADYANNIREDILLSHYTQPILDSAR